MRTPPEMERKTNHSSHRPYEWESCGQQEEEPEVPVSELPFPNRELRKVQGMEQSVEGQTDWTNETSD